MIVIVTQDQFDAWRNSYGLGAPFEHDGRSWVCVSVCYPALDRFGYSPASQLGAGEVWPEEVWPEASTDHGAPGTRGVRHRVGHSGNGRPYVYTGVSLLASINCGKPTEHSPGGAIFEPFELL